MAKKRDQRHYETLIIQDHNGRFIKGNDANRKYSKEMAVNEFLRLEMNMRGEEAKQDPPYLSMQEVIMDSPFSSKVFYDLIKNFPECDEIHKDMINNLNAIIARKSLLGEYHATAAIWRHKQLHEVDRQVVEQEVKEQPMFNALPPAKKQEALPEGKADESEDES